VSIGATGYSMAGRGRGAAARVEVNGGRPPARPRSHGKENRTPPTEARPPPARTGREVTPEVASTLTHA
jgi:hypothetical protein